MGSSDRCNAQKIVKAIMDRIRRVKNSATMPSNSKAWAAKNKPIMIGIKRIGGRRASIILSSRAVFDFFVQRCSVCKIYLLRTPRRIRNILKIPIATIICPISIPRNPLFQTSTTSAQKLLTCSVTNSGDSCLSAMVICSCL